MQRSQHSQNNFDKQQSWRAKNEESVVLSSTWTINGTQKTELDPHV